MKGRNLDLTKEEFKTIWAYLMMDYEQNEALIRKLFAYAEHRNWMYVVWELIRKEV